MEIARACCGSASSSIGPGASADCSADEILLVQTFVDGCGHLQVLREANALNSILGSLPGVNPDDPALQTALRNLQGDKDSKSDIKKDSK